MTTTTQLALTTGSEVAIVTVGPATRAQSDRELLLSWVSSLTSEHSRRNFEASAERFLAALHVGVRAATVEDVRDALGTLTADVAASTARQYVLRVKSFLTYAYKLGYTPFNAGVTIKVKGGRGRAAVAERILGEVEVGLLIRASVDHRDRMLISTLYAAGLRVSECAALTWANVIERDQGRLQLSIDGKGGVNRQVLLPTRLSTDLRVLRGDAPASAPVFPSRKGGGPLTVRAILGTIKRTARRAGITGDVSPHWLRHAHGSHALDRGATLAEVQETLGHANVSTTSGYLHARPNTSSGLHLDDGIFRLPCRM